MRIFQFLVVDNSHMAGMKYYILEMLVYLLDEITIDSIVLKLPGDEMAIAERSEASVVSHILIDSSISKRNVFTYQF